MRIPKLSEINLLSTGLGLLLGYFGLQLSTAEGAESYGAVSVRNPVLSFDISDDGADTASTSGASLHYQPKMPTVIGLETSIKGFTMGISQTLARNEEKEEQKFSDYSLSYYLQSIGFSALYSEFLAFRLTSAEKLDLSAIPQTEKFRRDFAIKTTNFNLYYFPLRLGWDLSKNLEPSEMSHTTGLGLGLVASYNNIGIDTQYGAIPQAFQANFGEEGSLKKGSFTSTSLSAVIGATLAVRSIFLSIMGSAGGGQQTQSYEINNGSRNNRGMGNRQSFLGLLGFSNKSFFFGLQFVNVSPRFELRDLGLSAVHNETSLKLGVKF
jgi:hypothetical protein